MAGRISNVIILFSSIKRICRKDVGRYQNHMKEMSVICLNGNFEVESGCLRIYADRDGTLPSGILKIEKYFPRKENIKFLSPGGLRNNGNYRYENDYNV